MTAYEQIEYISGGRASRKNAEEILGIDALSGDKHSYRITAIEYTWLGIEISVIIKDRPPLKIYVMPSKTDQGSRNEQLETRTNDENPNKATIKLMNHAEAFVSDMNMLSLMKMLLSDPESRVVLSPAAEDRKSIVRAWGKKSQWRFFFAEREMAEGMVKNFIDATSGNKVIGIAHTDHECIYLGLPRSHFFGFTYTSLTEKEKRTKPEAGDIYKRLQLSTDVGDMDVVMGSSIEKLEEAVNAVAKTLPGWAIVVVNCCVPMLIGDEIGSIVERFRNQENLYIVLLDQALRSAAVPFTEPLKKIKEEPDFFDKQRNPLSFNLAGCGIDRSMEELLEFLEGMHISLNVSVFPDIPIENFHNYMRASAQVLFSTEMFKGIFKEFFDGIDMPTVAPPQPFGIENTRNWLREIARALEVEEHFEKYWKEYYFIREEKIETLKEEASKYRIGIVLAPFQVDNFFDPEVTMGIPLPQMLESMGFGLDFILFDEIEELFEAKRAYIINKMDDPGRLRVERFQTQDELDRLLDNTRLQAAFSDYLFDKRLSRRGLPYFSTNLFEKGIDGYIRTTERILAVCRIPFYYKYSEYLRRAEKQHV